MDLKKIAAPLGALFIAVLLLSGIKFGLKKTANERMIQEKQEMMQILLPGSETFEEIAYDGEDTNINAVFQGENGYVIETIVSGYVDDIRIWVGVDAEGNVTGTMIREMSETWGLGRRAMTDRNFLAQFVGTKGEAELGIDIDTLSGATVTSKAVVKGINSAAAYVTGEDVSSGATQWGG